MTPEHFPADPRSPTIPAVGDEDPMRLMRELRAALENVSELAVRLDTTLAKVYLAELANEHQTNMLRERADAHEARIRELERVGRAAE